MTVIDYTLSEKTALIRMDDGKANALSYAMMDEVEEALNRAEREASAVVLAGRPGRFCAGFDLREMMKGADSARALVTRGADFLLRLYLFPRPLVVACSGHALAGGALTVLTGDLRLGAQGAFRVGLNEVQIGMPVPILAMELARDRLAPRALQEATLFARIYAPDEAVEAGYLDRVVDEAALLEEATREATRLAALPGDAYARTKTILRERTVNYVRQNLEMDMIRLTPPTAT
jgi:enoyl-CoA hydratase